MVIFSDNIILFIVVIITTMVLVLLFLLLILKKHFINQDRENKKIKNSINEILVSYLHNNETNSFDLETIKTLFKRKKEKEILIQQLLVMNHNFSGIYSDKVFQLYKELELYTISYKKIRRYSWYIKIQGMYELSTLQYDNSYVEICMLINHKNDRVKQNVLISMIKLRKIEALLTLKDMELPMSEWTFIIILGILKREPIKITREEFDQLNSCQSQFIRKLSNKLMKVKYV